MLTPELRIKLGQWLPDVPYNENPGLVEAKNTIPAEGFYKDYLPLETADDALGDRVIGAFAAVDTEGNSHIYCGIDSDLYLKAGSSYTDLTATVFTTAVDGYWRFTQFDDQVIATNFSDVPQAITAGSSTANDLATSGTAPSARQVGVINRFVVLGDTDFGGDLVPNRIQWSAIDDCRTWPTPNTAAARTVQSGEQVLPAVQGAVTAIANGDFFGLVFQKRGITRATYVGGDVVFQFQTVDFTRGCWFPQSMAQVGQHCYFIAADGFYATDGLSVKPIGAGKVDRYFFADVDQTYIERVTVAVDYINKCIFWSYPNFSATSGVPNAMLIYNYAEDRWARAEDSVTLIFSSVSDGYTLDQLDALYPSLDDVPVSLDSTVWQGGANTMMGFGGDFKLGTFSGTALVARFETGGYELNPFGYMFIRGVRPRVTGNPTSVAVSIGSRDNQDNETRSFTANATRTTRTGVCDFRETVRFGTIRLEVTGGFDRALGVDVDGEPSDQV
jgi:hypothetical protein